MKRVWCQLFFAGFLLFVVMGAWCEGETAKRIGIPKLEGAVVLDGKLDEAVWGKAYWESNFRQNETGAAVRSKTSVALWHDDENLYLGWRCEDMDIQATYTQHDSTLWDEEVVELFVAPVKEIPTATTFDYFELQWNPLGTMFDAIIHNQLDTEGWSVKMDGDWDWNAKGMRCAVFVVGTVGQPGDTDGMWQVEVVIPFSALGVTAPRKGELWRGNLFRYCRDAGQEIELQSVSPTTKPSFHQPKKFAILEFGSGDSTQR
jgi:hypothetical protein